MRRAANREGPSWGGVDSSQSAEASPGRGGAVGGQLGGAERVLPAALGRGRPLPLRSGQSGLPFPTPVPRR